MSSSQLPSGTAVAAETTALWSRRRRRLTWARVGRASVPYWLILPVAGAISQYVTDAPNARRAV